jgi:hypothetical protein
VVIWLIGHFSRELGLTRCGSLDDGIELWAGEWRIGQDLRRKFHWRGGKVTVVVARSVHLKSKKNGKHTRKRKEIMRNLQTYLRCIRPRSFDFLHRVGQGGKVTVGVARSVHLKSKKIWKTYQEAEKEVML